MKILMKSIFKVLIFLPFAFYACGPSVYFEKPQPQRTSNQKSFKSPFMGTYRSANDSSSIIISPKMIMREGKVLIRRTRGDIDSSHSYRLQKDTLIDLSSRKKFPVKISNDTITYQLPEKDTLFVVSKDKLLRFMKGNHFLNYKISENHWYVKKMGFDKDGSLLISEIKVPDDIDNFKLIAEVKEMRGQDNPNSLEYLLDPKKKEMKAFLDKNGFRNTIRYTRIK